MSDVMWDEWVRVGGVAPDGVAGEAAIAMSTVQYLIVPGWAENLERYRAFMDTHSAAHSIPRGPRVVSTSHVP